MPLSFALEDSLLIYRAEGDVDFDSGLAVVAAGLAAARAQQKDGQLFQLLFDLRGSEEKRKSEDMSAIADLMSQNRDLLSGRGAVIAPADLQYGMARIFAVHSEEVGVEISVFRDGEAARAWLREPDRDSEDSAR